MGGKKKKSAAAGAPVAPAAAVAAAGRAGAAAAGNSVAEEPKKQPHSNKPAKPAKENKSKGGIDYLTARTIHNSFFGFCLCHSQNSTIRHIIHIVNHVLSVTLRLLSVHIWI